MGNKKRQSVTVTTATGGGATEYSAVVQGTIRAIKYTKDGTAPLASTADFTITTEETGQNLWVDLNVNATETVYPVVPANIASSGAASTLTEVPVYADYERVKIVVAQGGNTKIGTFTIVSD
jgi:hypothetical protein